jgi:DNA polymerase-3 subunit delta'
VAEHDAPWPVTGHAATLAGLWRAARAQRLPHALSFQGPSGVGKFRAARALAQGLLCARGPRDEGPCGTCGPCKRFLAEGHPDLLVIDPPREVDEQIRLGYVVRREGPNEPALPADEFLSLKAMEGGWRIVIVRNAERMVEQAQNALLKMLEEPGASVLWILVSARPAELLPTVRSRLVPVRFAPLDTGQCLSVLREHGLEGEDAARLARWAGGSPGLALDLAERGVLAMRPILIALLTADAAPFAAAGALALLEGRFEGKTPSGRERERARTVIELAAALVGDLARIEVGLDPARVPHGDLAPLRPKLALANSPPLLRAALQGLATVRADVELNLDSGQAIERTALILAAREPAQLVC